MIELRGGTPTYQVDALKSMIKKADLDFKNVYVIAISGVYRSGKSFLLNLLYTYIEYYIKVNGT